MGGERVPGVRRSARLSWLAGCAAAMAVAIAVVLGGWRLWTGSRAAAPPGSTVAKSGAAGTRPALPRLRNPQPRRPAGFEDQLADVRRRLGSSPTPEEVMDVLGEIAWTDPALAIDLADALGQTEEERTAWIEDLARQWAGRQPEQAWSWMSAQQPDRLRDLATGTVAETVIGTLAERHPRLLVQSLDHLVHAGESGLGVAPVVAAHLGLEALAASGRPDLARQAVESWARAAGGPPIGESAYLVAARAISEAAPDIGGRWLMSLPASEERDTALVELPAHWARTQPRAAVEWASERLPAHLRLRGLRRAFGEWADQSPTDAAAWLAAHLAGSTSGTDADALVALLNLARRTPDED